MRINGALKQTMVFAGTVRNADRLLADVSEFMTLAPGDVLMLRSDIGITVQIDESTGQAYDGKHNNLHPLFNK